MNSDITHYIPTLCPNCNAVYILMDYFFFVYHTHTHREREGDKKRNIKTYADMHRNRATGEVEGDHVQEQSNKTL